MANSGKNTNTSQFYITFGASDSLAKLDGKHVVFGKVSYSVRYCSFVLCCARERQINIRKLTLTQSITMNSFVFARVCKMQVVEGVEVLSIVESRAASESGKPVLPVIITDCGVL